MVMRIEVNGVACMAAGRQILAPMSARFEAGRFCAILGPNGAGKSTLLGVLSAQRRPHQGDVRMNSRSGRMSCRIVVAISSIDLVVVDNQRMPLRRIMASPRHLRAAILQRCVARVRPALVADLAQALGRDRQAEQFAAVRDQRRRQLLAFEILGDQG
jgi:ABC-2 type transport system ATP-binding protein